MPQNFIHISDLHFWQIVRNPLKMLNKRMLGNTNLAIRRSKHFLQENADFFHTEIKDSGIKTVLLGGDFTTTATPTEFAKAHRWVQKLEAYTDEIALLPGNHDVYTHEALRKHSFEKTFADYLPKEGYPCLIPLSNGITLIMAPTVCPNLLSSKGRITAEEIRKTVELVDKAPSGPLVLMAHYPCIHKTYAYRSGSSRQLRNADKFRKALGATGRPLLYLAGHVHQFSYVRDPDYPQMSHLCSPAFFLHRPKSEVNGAFNEVEVVDGAFKVYLHEHRESWSREERPLCNLDGKFI